MAIITGGTVRNPHNGQTVSWVPTAPIARAYKFITEHATNKYRCLGVIGNLAHLKASHPGDHTPFSTHDITVGGRHYVPKRGWVYAIDAIVPEMDKFEKWFLGRLRAGFYRWVKYWNISHRHWARQIVKSGIAFAKASYSGDGHLHISGMPDYEYASDDVFGDYEHYRTTGKNRPAPAPRPVPPAVKPVDVAARELPTIRKGSKGLVVKLAQAALVAQSFWHANDAGKQIDGDFGPMTNSKVRVLQTQKDLPVTGVVDTATWDVLMPDTPPTVIRGSHGYYPKLLQCLLIARGYSPGAVDGDAGDKTIAALKRFQVAKKVPNSVVRGRGDGIAGNATWVALLTP